jgi:hypothetical protein
MTGEADVRTDLPGYLRYVDDMVVLDEDKIRLAQYTHAALCRAQSRFLHGAAGRGAWVSMSSLPGLAGTGAPNSVAWEGAARGW